MGDSKTVVTPDLEKTIELQKQVFGLLQAYTHAADNELDRVHRVFTVGVLLGKLQVLTLYDTKGQDLLHGHDTEFLILVPLMTGIEQTIASLKTQQNNNKRSH